MHIGKVWWQFETSKWSLEKTSLWKKIATKSFLQIKKYNVKLLYEIQAIWFPS